MSSHLKLCIVCFTLLWFSMFILWSSMNIQSTRVHSRWQMLQSQHSSYNSVFQAIYYMFINDKPLYLNGELLISLPSSVSLQRSCVCRGKSYESISLFVIAGTFPSEEEGEVVKFRVLNSCGHQWILKCWLHLHVIWVWCFLCWAETGIPHRHVVLWRVVVNVTLNNSTKIFLRWI